MLAFIAPLITKGVIDNTVRDRIVLELELASGGSPLHVELRGNCLQDIAGCRVEFENGLALSPREAAPQEGDAASTREADIVQLIRSHGERGGKFLAGDITLSRREYTGSTLHNLLSLEFFIDTRVRVLLQSVRFRFTIARGTWRLNEEEHMLQRLLNREVMHEHVLYSVRHFRGATVALTGPNFPLTHWDIRINRAEAYMSIMPTLREKYRHEPDGHLSEAYLVDRTDLLTEAAEEEDAYGHGSSHRCVHCWEMIDFVEPEHVDQVEQAMHHPLFHDTSRLTDAVREHIIDQYGKAVSKELVQVFIPLYSSLVSHILSTLLLTLDESYCVETVALRMDTLRKRLADIGEGIATLPSAQRQPLEKALTNLSAALTTFCSTLH